MPVGDIVAKNKLSGSADGLGIKLTQTATGAEETIHTAVAGTTNFDEVWIFATNNHTDAVEVTLEFGGTTDPDHCIKKTIPKDDGLICICPGLVLQNGSVIKAFASVADVISLYGYVHNMTE